MGYIYIIKNDINNKVYIGQTIKTINYRLLEHFRQAKEENLKKRPTTYFHAAINKYGKEHFFVEKLEECPDEMLNEREKYWINYYNSYNNGYNSTLGGQFPSKKRGKQILQYDLNGNFMTIFKDANEAAKELNINPSYIRLVCNEKTTNKTAFGYQWKYYTENFPLKIPSTTTKGRGPKKINQYDLFGNFIKTFNSVKEAAKETNQTERNIRLACEGKQNKAGNFQWRYENEKPPTNLIIKKLSKYCNPTIPIEQLDKQNNIIKVWDSIFEAAIKLNLDAKKIGLVCEGKQKTYSKFLWRYKI